MEIKRAAELLRGLADGVDPMTGRPLPDESVYNRPEIIRALHCVLRALQERADGAAATNAGRSPVTRFVRSVQTTGGVSAVRELCRRNRPSDAFDSLAQAGRLDLSAEASAVKGKYGPLFTDEEVNACLALLLEAGYFQKAGR